MVSCALATGFQRQLAALVNDGKVKFLLYSLKDLVKRIRRRETAYVYGQQTYFWKETDDMN